MDNTSDSSSSSQELFIDKSCKMLIGDLEKVTNKQGSRDIDKSNKELTHMSDAFGYGVEWEFPVIKPSIGVQDR